MRTAEEAQYYGDLMYAHAQLSGVTRILLDERGLKDEEDTMDAYEVAESETLAEMGMAGFRIALVTHPDNYTINQTWETVLQNRAINLRVFLEEDKALAWLTS